jgi:hypothetical protein
MPFHWTQTLLDTLKEGNEETSEKIATIRKKTRDRKKEIAEERRNRALVGMSAFGTLAGSANASDSAETRSTSMFASMFGLSAFAASSTSSQRKTRASTKDSMPQEKAQPSWMAEVRIIIQYEMFTLMYFSLCTHCYSVTDGSHGGGIRRDMCCVSRRQDAPTLRVAWSVCIYEESYNPFQSRWGQNGY